MNTTLASQAAATYPDALRPLFHRVLTDALKNGDIQGLPVAGDTPDHLILIDDRTLAWMASTNKTLRDLLKPSHAPIPPHLVPHIDAPLLKAILQARAQPRPERPKATPRPKQDAPPAPQLQQPSHSGNADEPAA